MRSIFLYFSDSILAPIGHRVATSKTSLCHFDRREKSRSFTFVRMTMRSWAIATQPHEGGRNAQVVAQFFDAENLPMLLCNADS